VRIRSGSLDEARTSGVAAPPGPPPAQVPAPPQPPLSSAAPQPPGSPSAGTPAAPGPQQPPQPAPVQPPSRSAAVLEVTDHGPGLSSEQAEHAFERFYRADQARTTGGTGLGLAIVAALVTAHGGAVWVESAPGAGATFRIALPLAPEAMHPDDDHLADDEPEPDAGPESAAGPEPAADLNPAAEPGPSAGPHDGAEPGGR
jgi:Histidine kinase-, DNA gyrase B-, and HSP90-like ATPase